MLAGDTDRTAAARHTYHEVAGWAAQLRSDQDADPARVACTTPTGRELAGNSGYNDALQYVFARGLNGSAWTAWHQVNPTLSLGNTVNRPCRAAACTSVGSAPRFGKVAVFSSHSRWDGQVAVNKRPSGPPREKPQQIADELREMIVTGGLSEGYSLGREPELIERFGVSRPSLREALRILEAEGLISVVRGVYGGVVVHEPDQRLTARTASLVLRARNVELADVFEARALLEPLAARAIASKRNRRASVAHLSQLIDHEEEAIEDPEQFGIANGAFHEQLVALGGNQTLTIVAEMLEEIVVRAVTEVSKSEDVVGSLSTRRRGLRSQRRLLQLIEAGDANGAEAHWRSHMAVVGQVMLGQKASTVVDLLHEYR
jgi:GntR family transcriptional repressor for pyruvate dehydrogenase complex